MPRSYPQLRYAPGYALWAKVLIVHGDLDLLIWREADWWNRGNILASHNNEYPPGKHGSWEHRVPTWEFVEAESHGRGRKIDLEHWRIRQGRAVVDDDQSRPMQCVNTGIGDDYWFQVNMTVYYTHLNDAVSIDVSQHLVHDRADNIFIIFEYSETNGCGIEIGWELFCSQLTLSWMGPNRKEEDTFDQPIWSSKVPNVWYVIPLKKFQVLGYPMEPISSLIISIRLNIIELE